MFNNSPLAPITASNNGTKHPFKSSNVQIVSGSDVEPLNLEQREARLNGRESILARTRSGAHLTSTIVELLLKD